MSHTTAAISASDFSDDITDSHRALWTAGKLRHVIAALDGTPVAVVTNKMTGHAVVGVTLDGLRQNPDGGGHQVLITYEYAPGESTRTWTHVLNIGETIIPITGMGAHPSPSPRWTALETHRREGYNAIILARATDLPAGEEYTRLRTRSGLDYVHITSHDTNGHICESIQYRLEDLNAWLATGVAVASAKR